VIIFGLNKDSEFIKKTEKLIKSTTVFEVNSPEELKTLRLCFKNQDKGVIFLGD